MYEYVIIGGGLSGSMLGYLLKKQGHDVVIFEKQLLSKKNKLCGGIITPKTYSLLISEFLKQDIDKIIKSKFKKCDIVDTNKFILDDVDIKIVDRKKLDDYILKQYLKLGGKVIEDSKVENIDFCNNTIMCNKEKYKFKYLIGADGTLSYVRNKLAGKMQNKNLALENFQTRNSDLNFTIEFVKKYKGYNWIIPINTEICYGTGNVSRKIKIEVVFNELANRYNLSKDKKGAFLPTGDDIFLNKKNVYFIGDAAGLISPITGEGIYYALYSAKKLFESFQSNKSYNKLMKPTCKKIKKELFLLKVIYNEDIRKFVFKRICQNTKFSKVIQNKVKNILLN